MFHDLEGPAVYIFMRQYPTQVVAYAGQAKRFLNRIHEWYRHFLAGDCYVRKSDGSTYSEGYAHQFFDNLDSRLEETAQVTCEEVRRTMFFYAHCSEEDLTGLESELIAKIYRKDETLCDARRFLCGNSVKPSFTEQRIVDHQLTDIKDVDSRQFLAWLLNQPHYICAHK